MTKIEQLKADLATIQNAARIAKRQGYPDRSGNYDMVESELRGKIAELEAQEQKVDPWAEIRSEINAFAKSLAEDPTPPGHFTVKTPIMSALIGYIRHLETKVAELESATIRTVEQNREKLAELTTILNAIPPACGLARELVERRIEGVKKEMQGNG